MSAGQPTPPTFTPRNLVVLSDGTGNSAAKLFKTNVWRVYEALDLNCPDQVALYDDGVGTASFGPLAMLGGAFGFGLKRNVLDLYMFLCRNYRVDPANPDVHDRIFAFGFSRGAFTARVLASLVAREGLIQGQDGAELTRLARWAYRRYRTQRYRNSPGVRLLRWTRNALLRLKEKALRQRAYDPNRNCRVDVDFLGVWDTVAAYGLPIDELTRGWDKWIWPMTPHDQRLSPRVKCARHALALDDERQTFFPVLWDERSEPANESSTRIADERISQVWFSGVHSNVGGGCPDDALALTSLCWIASEAADKGLRFLKNLRPGGGPIPEAWVERAAACAPMSDSRRGLGAYYRYHPRPVARLCDDRDRGVWIERPKIHESVFERVRDGIDGYAPYVLPPRYAIVTRKGDILSGNAEAARQGALARPNPYEHSTQAQARQYGQEKAWNFIWYRRWVYFATVGATLFVVLLPSLPIRDALPLAGESRVAGMVVSAIGSFVPGFADAWLDHYRHNPRRLVYGAVAILLLLGLSSFFKQAISDRMRGVWRGQGSVARPVDDAREPSDWVYRFRTSGPYRWILRTFSRTIWPHAFGILTFVLLVGVVPVRTVFEATSRTPGFCAGGRASPKPNGEWHLALEPTRLCHATGIEIEQGARYQVRIDLPPPGPGDPTCAGSTSPPRIGVWGDRMSCVSSPAGVESGGNPLLYLLLPLRRDLTANWFVPIASIGTSFPERHHLSGPDATIVAGRKGPLSLYVNDAIVPWRGWDRFYRDNRGRPALVRVKRLPAAPDGQGVR